MGMISTFNCSVSLYSLTPFPAAGSRLKEISSDEQTARYLPRRQTDKPLMGKESQTFSKLRPRYFSQKLADAK